MSLKGLQRRQKSVCTRFQGVVSSASGLRQQIAETGISPVLSSMIWERMMSVMKHRVWAVAFIVAASAIPLSAVSSQQSPKTVDEADRATFSSFDSDSSGTLSASEFGLYGMDNGWNQAQTSSMFGNLDGDSSGDLSFGEFTSGTCCV